MTIKMCQEFAGVFLQMISGLIIWELKILGNFCLFCFFFPHHLTIFSILILEVSRYHFKVFTHLYIMIITYSICIALILWEETDPNLVQHKSVFLYFSLFQHNIHLLGIYYVLYTQLLICDTCFKWSYDCQLLQEEANNSRKYLLIQVIR